MPEAHGVQAEHGGLSENVGMIVTTRKTFQSNNFTEYSQNRKYFLTENFSEAPEGNLSVFTSGSTALVTLQNCSFDLKNGINIRTGLWKTCVDFKQYSSW